MAKRFRDSFSLSIKPAGFQAGAGGGSRHHLFLPPFLSQQPGLPNRIKHILIQDHLFECNPIRIFSIISNYYDIGAVVSRLSEHEQFFGHPQLPIQLIVAR